MATDTSAQQKVMIKEMSWDPITRIVGSLGIHTEIERRLLRADGEGDQPDAARQGRDHIRARP
jgi:hypothetical protein